jgi:hypothetical protein
MPIKGRLVIGVGFALCAWVLGNIAYWAAIRFIP